MTKPTHVFRFDALDTIEKIVEKLTALEMNKKQLKESIQVLIKKSLSIHTDYFLTI